MRIVGRLLVCVLLLSACGDLGGSRVGASGGSTTPDSRFGFVVSHLDGLSVTLEPGRAWQPFPDNSPDAHGGVPSVSPDGRLVAYWYGRGKYGPARPQELRVRDVTNGTTLTIFREDPNRLPSGGGAVAWASDSSGLVFAESDVPFSHRGLIASSSASLWLTDTKGATPRRLTISNAGFGAVTPIAWDRGVQVVAAVQGNVVFAVYENGRVQRHALPSDTSALAAKTAWSPTHGMVSSIELVPCGSGATCSGLRVWRIDDPRTANVYMPQGDEAVMARVFLPGTKDLLVLLRKGDTEARLERWADFGGGARRTLYSFSYGWDLAVRADGTAAIITSLGRYFPTPPPAYLVDPHTGQVTTLDLGAAPYSVGLVSVRFR
jgi:hypothetical protein